MPVADVLLRGGFLTGGYYAAGEIPEVPGIPGWILEIIKALGVVGFAVIIWYLERRERLDNLEQSTKREAELQARNDILVEKLEKVTQESIVLGQRMLDLINTGRRQR